MIPIKYPLKAGEQKKFHDDYLEAIGITDNIKDKFDKFKRRPKLVNFSFRLEDILLATFENLQVIQQQINRAHLNRHEIRWLKYFFDYTKMQPRIAHFFDQYNKVINLSTCYFCNIDFINTFNDFDKYKDILDFINTAPKKDLSKVTGIGDVSADRIIGARTVEITDIDTLLFLSNVQRQNIENFRLIDEYNHFTLDHLLAKSENPILALSLYNFVPSCAPCNTKFKTVKQFIKNSSMNYLSPTSKNFSFQDDVSFKIYYKDAHSVSTVTSKDNFLLRFHYDKNEKEYRDYVDTFKLSGRYVFHKNEIVELITKKQKYSETEIEHIAQRLSLSPQTVKEDIFGHNLFTGNVEDKSLTKLKRDIAKNIGIRGVL